jgi:SAM-dependent methyltransferase
MALARHCRQRFEADGDTPFVCATAESLPFRDHTFDVVVCQGSLDHFPEPQAFLREVARVLRPQGRAVIGISNYDSLSCRLGMGLYRLKEGLGRPVYRGRNYWQIPPNHTFRGTYRELRRLGEPYLRLEACRGVSMLWLFRRWTQLVQALPGAIAWRLLGGLDAIAYRTPALADIVISVWRPR